MTVFPEAIVVPGVSLDEVPSVHGDGEGEQVETIGILGHREPACLPVEDLPGAGLLAAGLIEHSPAFLVVDVTTMPPVVVDHSSAVLDVIVGTKGHVSLQYVLMEAAPLVSPVNN